MIGTPSDTRSDAVSFLKITVSAPKLKKFSVPQNSNDRSLIICCRYQPGSSHSLGLSHCASFEILRFRSSPHESKARLRRSTSFVTRLTFPRGEKFVSKLRSDRCIRCSMSREWIHMKASIGVSLGRGTRFIVESMLSARLRVHLA